MNNLVDKDALDPSMLNAATLEDEIDFNNSLQIQVPSFACARFKISINVIEFVANRR